MGVRRGVLELELDRTEDGRERFRRGLFLAAGMNDSVSDPEGDGGFDSRSLGVIDCERGDGR